MEIGYLANLGNKIQQRDLVATDCTIFGDFYKYNQVDLWRHLLVTNVLLFDLNQKRVTLGSALGLLYKFHIFLELVLFDVSKYE
jgi:hypothetical protein